MSNRTRIWVNFSKEYIKEYEMAIKGDNFSGLICFIEKVFLLLW